MVHGLQHQPGLKQIKRIQYTTKNDHIGKEFQLGNQTIHFTNQLIKTIIHIIITIFHTYSPIKKGGVLFFLKGTGTPKFFIVSNPLIFQTFHQIMVRGYNNHYPR